MDKTTPGPWRAYGGTVYAGDLCVAGAYCESWREISDQADDTPLPDSDGTLNEYGNSKHGAGCEEAWANADLIAAAPDLLAALDAMLREYGTCGTTLQQQAADMAMAAVNKARGRNDY